MKALRIIAISLGILLLGLCGFATTGAILSSNEKTVKPSTPAVSITPQTSKPRTLTPHSIKPTIEPTYKATTKTAPPTTSNVLPTHRAVTSPTTKAAPSTKPTTPATSKPTTTEPTSSEDIHPGAFCGNDRVGDQATHNNIVYTCKGPKPYRWRR